MAKLRELIPMFFVLLLVFYDIYPQALSVRGSSFVSLAGVIGLGVYAYHRFPFREVVWVMMFFMLLELIIYSSSWMHQVQDHYTFGYMRSQVAWFFTAYLIVFSIFKVHKKPNFNTVLFYIVGAIALQSIITFVMYLNEGVKDFFFSIQMQADYTEAVVEEASTQRLMGYGIGFFGAGAISGIALILLSYLFMKMRFTTKQFLLLATLYTFIFFIGLFMARTTVVGMAVGFMLIGVLYLRDHRSLKKQARTFFVSLIFLFIGGYIFAMFYFPSFSDWAFELFINFIKTGKFQTRSSSGLEEMFIIPKELDTLIFGTGQMAFHGTDVGYSRLLYWIGVPGTIIFFVYQLFVIKESSTKDWAVNAVAMAIFVYALLLNIKGWIDLNLILYIIFFYFMFHKYYVYIPNRMLAMRQNTGMLKRE